APLGDLARADRARTRLVAAAAADRRSPGAARERVAGADAPPLRRAGGGEGAAPRRVAARGAGGDAAGRSALRRGRRALHAPPGAGLPGAQAGPVAAPGARFWRA